MHFRVVDEHGRQLGMGRNLARLKAELGAQARGAFQALAVLKVRRRTPVALRHSAPGSAPAQAPDPATVAASSRLRHAARSRQRYTSWNFGELPELMEMRKGGQTLIGFPALSTRATPSDRGLRRARCGRGQAPRRPAPPVRAADQGRAEVPGKEHPRPAEDGHAPSCRWARWKELRTQIIDVALDRAFLLDPLPTNAAASNNRLAEGRWRLTLIAARWRAWLA
jgi:ATP-dependent helicase HrpA